MNRQAERSDATREALVRAARELFASRGYAAVGPQEIVRRAKVTRGALYHHFEDKRDLFRAVHEQIEGELTEAIGAKLADSDAVDPLEALRAETRTCLDACTEPEIDASGLRISWAMPAASSPTAASCSLNRAWRSSFLTSVRSWKTMSTPSSPEAGSFSARTE